MPDPNPAIEQAGPVFGTQFDILKLELSLIDNAIRAHDDITKNIKNWAIVAWTGSIGFAVSNAPLRPFVWATAFVPMAFWIVDGSFRRIQRSFILRVQQIADFINGPQFLSSASAGTPFAFALMRMRSKSGKNSSWARVMAFRTVFALYLLMILGSILMHCITRYSFK